jgi:hypothetical protein
MDVLPVRHIWLLDLGNPEMMMISDLAEGSLGSGNLLANERKLND